jgi:Lrp/AsnC family transcriptional regulator for asnA, asnC and gidA
MDALDLKIIAQLQRDGRATNATVARSTEASEETIRRRRFRLIEQGYVQVVAVPAARRLGYKTEVIIGVRSDVEKLDEVADALAKLNEVTWVSISTGSFDIIARVIVRTTEGLHKLMLNRIYQIPGIRSVETFMVLENVKQEYGLTSKALIDLPA